MRHRQASILLTSCVFALRLSVAVPGGLQVAATKANRNAGLFQAIEKGDMRAVKDLLDKGADVNARDERGQTPLIYAMEVPHEGLFIREWEESESEANAKRELVRLLLARGADINARDKSGLTALMYAVWAHGLIVDDGDNFSLVKVFLEQGADVKVRDKYGTSALALAKTPRVIEALIENGADLRTDGGAIFARAASQQRIDNLQWLLDRGVKVNARDFRGGTALMHAAFMGDNDTVSFLLARGANVNAQDKDGITPLISAASGRTPLLQEKGNRSGVMSKEGFSAVMNMLLKKGARINAKDSRGWTALVWAACNGDGDAVKLLLDKGADVSVRSKRGETIIQLVRNTDSPGRFAVIELLKKAGAEE